MKTQNKKRFTGKILMGMTVAFLSANMSSITVNAWDTKDSKEEMGEDDLFGSAPIRSWPDMGFSGERKEKLLLRERLMQVELSEIRGTPSTKGTNLTFTLKVEEETEPTSLFQEWTTYLRKLIGKKS